MVILVNNASAKMVERFLDSNLARKKLAWIGVTHNETTICLEDSTYILESGRLYTGREFVNIRSEGEVFPIYNGEYDTIIME